MSLGAIKNDTLVQNPEFSYIQQPYGLGGPMMDARGPMAPEPVHVERKDEWLKVQKVWIEVQKRK